jgi:hypothetical protein
MHLWVIRSAVELLSGSWPPRLMLFLLAADHMSSAFGEVLPPFGKSSSGRGGQVPAMGMSVNAYHTACSG